MAGSEGEAMTDEKQETVGDICAKLRAEADWNIEPPDVLLLLANAIEAALERERGARRLPDERIEAMLSANPMTVDQVVEVLLSWSGDNRFMSLMLPRAAHGLKHAIERERAEWREKVLAVVDSADAAWNVDGPPTMKETADWSNKWWPLLRARLREIASEGK
jgi:hypothetical protein